MDPRLPPDPSREATTQIFPEMRIEYSRSGVATFPVAPTHSWATHAHNHAFGGLGMPPPQPFSAAFSSTRQPIFPIYTVPTFGLQAPSIYPTTTSALAIPTRPHVPPRPRTMHELLEGRELLQNDPFPSQGIREQAIMNNPGPSSPSQERPTMHSPSKKLGKRAKDPTRIQKNTRRPHNDRNVASGEVNSSFNNASNNKLHLLTNCI